MEHVPPLEEIASDLLRLFHDVAPERGNELAQK